MPLDRGSRAHSIAKFVAGITGLIITLVGVFFLCVGRGKPSVTWLGILQITVGVLNIEPGLWTSNPTNFAFLATINLSLIALAPVASLAFAMRFYEENLGPVGEKVTGVWPLYIAFVALTTGMYDYSWLGLNQNAKQQLYRYCGLFRIMSVYYLHW